MSTNSRRCLRIIWNRTSATAAGAGLSLLVAILLAGCAPATTGGTSGAPSAGTPSTPKPVSCKPDGTSIPDGHYSGPIKATIKTTMTISADGISLPNAGGGTEAWKGTVDLISSGGKVTGTITMSDLGLSQVGTSGGVQVHSVENGDLKGTIAGPASKPAVAATGTGEWASLDAPVLNGSGTNTSSLSGGLHITKADCSSISGDAVAMFSDFMSPVAQYLAVSGDGTWVAKRQ